MPRRCEPVTLPMIDNMKIKCRTLDSDCLDSALYDWHVMGNMFGFRLLEWAQNNENKKHFPLLAVDGTPLAFTFEDFIFTKRINVDVSQGFNVILNPDQIHNVTVR